MTDISLKKRVDEKRCAVEGCNNVRKPGGFECKTHYRQCVCGERVLVGWGVCKTGYEALPMCETKGCTNRLDGECINLGMEESGEIVDSPYCDLCLSKMCFYPDCENPVEGKTSSCRVHHGYPRCVKTGCNYPVEIADMECPYHGCCAMCMCTCNPTESGLCVSCYVYGRPM